MRDLASRFLSSEVKSGQRNKFLVRHFDSFGSLNLCLR
ncbi:BnaC04g55970D [Brassica napus]|uniref:BnaC04g55970D protein n=1 Tax=Brassica napus TaxID=3708 RepID=A0A078IWY7_BRANA|nr:BnaC04g55970D [Brassica napus]